MSEVFEAVISLRDNTSAVLKQAKESSSQFRQEVEKAKRELDKLDKQKVKAKELKLKGTAAYQEIDKIKQKLKPLSDKAITLKAKTERAQEQIKKVADKLRSVKENKVVNIAVKGAANVAKALGTAALAGGAAAFAAVAAAGGTAVRQAVDFQSQMQNVGTLLTGDTAAINSRLEEMKSQIKSVSIDTGVATSDLTDGLYQVVSAFGDSADSVGILETAAKAAKAGNATTTDSVNLLSAVTKGYGDTSAEAVQKASDLAFETVRLGQTSFPEMAASMGKVIPAAASLKVSQEELYGAFATLTGVTGSTAEVSTQLKAVMSSFMNPSKDMASALKKIGYESGAAALENESLGSILEKLKDSVGGNDVAFGNMFSSVEATTAVLALAGNQADAFSEKTAAMEKASGATDRAFGTQTASVAEMAARIKNAGSVMLTSLGEKTLPFITKELDKLQDKLPEIEAAFDKVADNVGPVLELVSGKLSDVWAVIQPVAESIKNDFAGAFEECLPAIDSMTGSFEGILPVVLPVVESVMGGVAKALPVVTNIFSGISSVVSSVAPTVGNIISGVCEKAGAVMDVLKEHTSGLQDIFEAVGPAIGEYMQTAWNVLSPILDLMISGFDLLVSAVEWAFPRIQSVIESVWNVIKPIADMAAKGIGAVADAVSAVADKVGAGRSSKSTSVQQHATGTSYHSGGWTTVGEHGPELLNLPAGSKVLSNQTSANIMADADRAVPEDRIRPAAEAAIKGITAVSIAASVMADKAGAVRSTGVQQHATGTAYHSGGWTTVGEHGPELLNLPAGSKVLSNQTSTNRNVQSGDTVIHIHIQNMQVREEDDIDQIAEKIAERIEEARDNM